MLFLFVPVGRRAIDNTKGFLLSRIRAALSANPDVGNENQKQQPTENDHTPYHDSEKNARTTSSTVPDDANDPVQEETENTRETSKWIMYPPTSSSNKTPMRVEHVP